MGTQLSPILQTDEAQVYNVGGLSTAPQMLFLVEIYGDNKSMVVFYIQYTCIVVSKLFSIFLHINAKTICVSHYLVRFNRF